MSPRFTATYVALAALFLGSASGQNKGTTPPPSGSTGNGNTGSTPTRPSTTTPNNNPNNTNTTTIQRPIFLTGKVMIDDGTPLSEPAAIIRVCNGSPHTEGYTDSTGGFGIELGADRSVLQDASETGGFNSGLPNGIGRPSNPGLGGNSAPLGGNTTFGDRRLANCELQARLAGYRSQSVMLVNRQALDDPNVGTILLHRISKGDEGSTVSARSLAAPKDARKAFEKGLEQVKKRKIDDAEREFQKAVAIYPQYATAWCELGKIEAARGQADIARGSFNEAAKSDPKYVDPYLELSRLALNAKNWPELAELTGKALALDSFDYPQEFLFDAVAHYNMHDYDAAEKSVQRAELLDTRHNYPQIAYLKGLVQIQHKDYTLAAQSLRDYLKLAPDAEDAAKVREQLTQLNKFLEQSAAAKQQQ